MSIQTIRFFTVKMPDDKEYAICGNWTIKKISSAFSVPANKIYRGASSRLPHISEYFEKENKNE